MSQGGRPAITRISVVVPVLDQARELADQLDALVAQQSTVPFEVLVADNGSRDHTPHVIAERATLDGRIKGVDASARRGPSAARNTGAAGATGDALAFCDADDIVAPGWLQSLASALSDADVVAGTFDFGSLNDTSGVRTPLEYSASFGFLPAGLGANLAVRRDAFEGVGGFAEDLLAGEDIDLCWRLQLAGLVFAASPDAVVAKRERADPRARRRQLVGYGRHDAALYRRFRRHGMPRNLTLTAKTYGWLVLYAPRALVDRRTRTTWTRALFIRWGRVRGSVEHRVVFF
jgi:cellulose synthase/poly-beta-1,6-N-acetylglucosamine synthase-like glycosyltransferase